MEMKATRVLERLLKTEKRFILSVGSSRSSKTYSMMQWIVLECARRRNEGIYISVVRAGFPSLRRTVLREFVDLLKQLNLYSDNLHNKSEHKINLFGNYVEFFSLNDSQKVRGAKRNYLYLNECNEIDYEAAQQLFLRTTERVFMDQNPSDAWHWSFKMKDREDVDYIHSTYLDNPFLSETTIKQIESYKNHDENLWRVYGLGLPGFSTTTIYQNWLEWNDEDIICYSEDGKPQPVADTFVYGLDVGYNHAMALVKVHIKDENHWVEEIVYRSNLTSSDLIKLMKDLDIETDKDIWVDAAAPSMIEDLKRAGYTAKSADKSVKEGIDLIRSKKLYLNINSTNLIDEIRKYQWKTKGEQIIYEPIKLNDDLMDAMRYAIWNYWRKTKRSEDYDFDIEFL